MSTILAPLNKHLTQCPTAVKIAAALGVIYLVWGTTLAGMHLAVESMPIEWLLCGRFLLAGLLFIGLCLAQGEELPSLNAIREHGWIGILVFLGGNSVVCWAIQTVPTGIAGVLIAMTPVWMVLMARFLPGTAPDDRERIEPKALLGMSMGFIGILVLLSPFIIAQAQHTQTHSLLFWICVIAIAGQSLFWAYGSLLFKRLGKHDPNPISTFMSIGLQSTMAGVVLIPLAIAKFMHDPTAVHHITPSSWFGFVYLIVFGSMIALPCYWYIVKNASVTVAGSFAYINPITTLIVGTVLFHEVITWQVVVGSLLALLGVVVIQWTSAKPVSESIPVEEQLPLIDVLRPNENASALCSCAGNRRQSMPFLAPAQPTECDETLL